MTEDAIVTQGLTRVFGSLRAVDDMTLLVARGTIFGFLGPNGAGKTTTIRLLLGLLAPTAGAAAVLGRDTRTQADAIRERTGALLEHSGIYERLSARTTWTSMAGSGACLPPGGLPASKSFWARWDYGSGAPRSPGRGAAA